MKEIYSLLKCILSWGILLTCIPVFAQINLKNGLVAYYPFDGNANDWGGNHFNGVIQSGITDTKDRFGAEGKALNFPGSTGLYSGNGVIVSNNNLLNFTGSYSISLWFEWSGTVTGINNSWDWQHLISKGRDADNSYGIVIQPSTSALYFYQTNDNNGDNASVTCTITSGLTNWHHVIAISDLSASSLSVYIDRQLFVTNTFAGFHTSITNFKDLGIGLHNGDYGIRYPFNGNIDDVRIYNRTLSIAEIEALFNNTTLTGIFDGQSADQYMSVYPNPNTGSFTIETLLNAPDISIINNQGIKIKSIQLPVGQHKITVDDIHAGLYIVSMHSGDQQSYTKIIVE